MEQNLGEKKPNTWMEIKIEVDAINFQDFFLEKK